MRLRSAMRIAALGVLLALWLGAAPARAQEAPPLPPPPKVWILVDADTGAVVSANQDRVPVPPASTMKLLTALIASQRLQPNDPIPISARAEGMPARKINVKAGQVWTYRDLLHSMLMVSANDAAVAIAEKLGGGALDAYVRLAGETAARLGLADNPVLLDPAGLDDEFSNAGGSLISARDLAIVARAVLREQALMQIMQTRKFEFFGGDGIGHVLNNHNLFLDLYPGAIGMKTGATDRAGKTFVGAATRNGRTMLAVVFDAVDPYASAGLLLDQGFATPASSAAADRLPDVVERASFPVAVAAPAGGPMLPQQAGEPVAHAGGGSAARTLNSLPVAVGVLLAGLVPLVFLHRRTLVNAISRGDQT